MELVYLWVEEYKNIHKQGFNFSPKFNCNYDPDTNELTIDENNDYIDNFFGDNINVTAILGKNGSGKSSVAEFLYLSRKNNDNKHIIVFYKKEEKVFVYLNVDIKLSFAFKTHYAYSTILDSDIYKNIDLGYINFSHFITNVFDENDGGSFLTINNTCIDDSYSTEDFSSGVKCYKTRKLIEVLYLFQDKKSIDFIEKEFKINKPFYMGIEFRNSNIDSISEIESINLIYEGLINELNLSMMNEEFVENGYSENLLISSIRKGISKKEIVERTNLIDEFISYSKDGYIELKYFNTIKEFLSLYTTLTIYNYFEITFHDINKKEIDFSSGEEIILSYLYALLVFQDKKQIIIDEIDLYLHPHWQKNIFSIILKYLLKQNIHIILTTHSPFLISDIPKQNIIFLDKDEKGNCKVVNGLKEKKQTFGANIHTLLSDSFFMEDGLMGEFAKGKIQQIMNLLNGKPSSYDYKFRYIFTNVYHFDLMSRNIKKVIDAIGEPFLRDKLLKMHEEKYPQTNEEKIKDLEAEIERIRSGKNQLQS